MAKREIEYNLNSLVELQNTILQIIKNRGDVEVPIDACLGSVPELINNLSNKSYVSNQVQTDIAKCGPLITRFAIFSDVHLGSPFTYPDTYRDNQGYVNGTAAIREYAKEAMDGDLDFIVFTGDTLGPEGGTADVYGALQTITDEWRSILAPTGIPFYMICGNHDSGCDISYWHKVSGIKAFDDDEDLHFLDTDRTCFWKEINGDLYIWFSLFNNKMFVYSDAQFEWLFDLLDSNKDKTRIFLFTHWYDGTVDGFGWRYLNGRYINHGWHEDDDERFGRIKEYKNLIWFSGHAHTDWKYEDTYPTIKVHSHNTARMVNVPSMKDNNQDVRVSVYSNMVVVEPYSRNIKLGTKIYFIGNGVTENVIRVNYFLTGVNSTNNKNSVSEGASFTTTLSLKDYYENMTVTVYMGGVDITSTAYNSSTGVISIQNVTGTIDITASATSTAKTYQVTYNLSGYHTSSANEIVENAPFSIVLVPDDGFDSNPTSINVDIDGIGRVVTAGYEDSDYIELITSPVSDGSRTTITFTSEMALGDIVVSAQATKTLTVTYDLSEDTVINYREMYVEYGQPYTTTVGLQDGSKPVVQVLINGLDYSAEYYNEDTGVIFIPAVTTDFTIKVQNLDSKYADCVKMIYNVTDISAPTQLLYGSYNVGKYITYMVVDGSASSIDGAVTYQFETTGRHTVYMKLTDNAFHSNFANGCTSLVYVKVPSNITTYSASMFRGCSNLEEVIINCTSSKQLSTYNFFETPKLRKVVFGSGITGIAQSNFDPTCTAFNEVYIYNPSSFNWLAGTLDNTGTLHCVDGADVSSVTSKLPNFTVVRDL